MTSLNTITKCDTHSPKWSAISTSHGIEYTFCENCEQNIDRFYVHDDYDRLPFWTEWAVTK
jgi:hypothetical protein